MGTKENAKRRQLVFTATVTQIDDKKYFSFKTEGVEKLLLIETLPCYIREDLKIQLAIKLNGSTIYCDPALDHLEQYLDRKKRNHLSVKKMKEGDILQFIFKKYYLKELHRKESVLIRLAWFFEQFEE